MGIELKIFPATMLKGRVIQWSDLKMLGMGRALVVREDLLHGTSGACESFASPPLSSKMQTAGTCKAVDDSIPLPAITSPTADVDFVVHDFECWVIGHEGNFESLQCSVGVDSFP